jgi:hypothetical protein
VSTDVDATIVPNDHFAAVTSPSAAFAESRFVLKENLSQASISMTASTHGSVFARP